jgi:hypothetical protein
MTTYDLEVWREDACDLSSQAAEVTVMRATLWLSYYFIIGQEFLRMEVVLYVAGRASKMGCDI